MLLLAESLDSGAIGGQFEQLYRRNQGLAITECHLPTNAAKNRSAAVLIIVCFRCVAIRVADPGHFLPDIGPENQNFKIGSGPYL